MLGACRVLNAVHIRHAQQGTPRARWVRIWRGRAESNCHCILSVRRTALHVPVAFSRFLAVLPLHNIHMNARLSGLPAFILNGLLDHQNACTDHYTACPLAGVLSMFLSPEALSMVLYWRGEGIEPSINGRFPTRRLLPQYRPAVSLLCCNVRIAAALLLMLLPP